MKFVAELRGETAIVVDTVTGESRPLTNRQLTKLTLMETVHGVYADCGVIMYVCPYQNPAQSSALQVKTSLFRNIDIIVYNDTVTNIKVRHEDYVHPVSIRLSDFGARCSDFILSGNRRATNAHLVTLVLDDKIEVTRDTFRIKSFTENEYLPYNTTEVGIYLDLRELHNSETAFVIYKQVILSKWDIVPGFKGIVDSPERKAVILDAIRDGL